MRITTEHEGHRRLAELLTLATEGEHYCTLAHVNATVAASLFAINDRRPVSQRSVGTAVGWHVQRGELHPTLGRNNRPIGYTITDIGIARATSTAPSLPKPEDAASIPSAPPSPPVVSPNLDTQLRSSLVRSFPELKQLEHVRALMRQEAAHRARFQQVLVASDLELDRLNELHKTILLALDTDAGRAAVQLYEHGAR